MLAAGNILFYIHTPIKVEGKGGVLYYILDSYFFSSLPYWNKVIHYMIHIINKS